MSTTVFPLNGAANAAELFALLAGQPNAVDFVGDGLSISIDTTTSEAAISSGTCYIRVDSDTIAGTDTQVRNLGYVVQLDSRTISIPSTGTIILAVVPDYSSPNTAAIEQYDTQSNVPATALSIATIDCDAGTVTSYNRAPDIEAESLTVIGQATINEDLTVSQDLIVEGTVQRGDGTVLFGPDTAIPVSELSSSSVTVETAGKLSGGGTISLGETLTLDVDLSELDNLDSNNDGVVDAADTASTADTAYSIEVRTNDPDNPENGQIWMID